MKSLSKFSISLEHILLQRLSLNLIPESNSGIEKKEKKEKQMFLHDSRIERGTDRMIIKDRGLSLNEFQAYYIINKLV